MGVETQNPPELKEHYIKLIESQDCICERYIDIKRADKDAGDGFFSLVFKAIDKLSKKPRAVALKFFNPLYYSDRYRVESFHRESRILNELKGQRNILPLIQEKTNLNLFLTTEQGVAFPLPFSFYSSLWATSNIKQYIYGNNKTYLTNMLYFKEMCKAVQRIHAKKICHRDLKPGNFLLFGKRYVTLSDFGTARYFGETITPLLETYHHPVGDLRYPAPEIICGLYFSDYHNFCADIYSLGAILFELFTRQVLGSIIFPDVRDLISHFFLVPQRDRIEVFHSIIGNISKVRPLPSVLVYNDQIPKGIALEVDRLYKSMASLDYRKREMSFQYIFLRILIIVKVIQIMARQKKDFEELPNA